MLRIQLRNGDIALYDNKSSTIAQLMDILNDPKSKVIYITGTNYEPIYLKDIHWFEECDLKKEERDMKEPKWGEALRKHNDGSRKAIEILDSFGRRPDYNDGELPNILLNEQILVDMKRKLATYQELVNPINNQIATLQADIWKMEDPKGYEEYTIKADHV